MVSFPIPWFSGLGGLILYLSKLWSALCAWQSGQSLYLFLSQSFRVVSNRYFGQDVRSSVMIGWLRLFLIFDLKVWMWNPLFYIALAAQGFLHWNQWDLDGSVATLAQQFVPRMCFACSVPKLFLQPAVKNLASLCFSNNGEKSLWKVVYGGNESQALLFLLHISVLHMIFFIGLLCGVSFYVQNTWGSWPNNWTELFCA